MERFISGLGLFVIVFLCFLLSPYKKKINWRLVFSGIFIQVTIAFLILKTTPGLKFFEGARILALGMLHFTQIGAEFIFGPLSNQQVFSKWIGLPQWSFVFATMVLPTIIFMSSLMSVLYHLGIMQKIVMATAFVMKRCMGTTGPESLAAAANIFTGQTEAPLAIRPYIANMTKSEILSLMTGGMASVAGGVMAAYVQLGFDAGHILAASVMSAPAALVCAKLLWPETEKLAGDSDDLKMSVETRAANVFEAAANGASEGMSLAINVAAMLLAFIALVSMVNAGIGYLGNLVGVPELSMEWILGHFFSPLAYLMGVPWEDAFELGSLLGKKLVVNEFVAYTDLMNIKDQMSPRSVIVATYALCGFANFSSIAIQIGGIGTLAPSRKSDLAKMGLRSVIGGTAACLMTACIAGLFINT